MVTILNKLNQPLVINLNSGRSLHLRPKKFCVITEGEFQSPEIKEKINYGYLVVLKMD